MKQIKGTLGFVFFLLNLFLISNQAFAATNQGVFSVKPIFPTNQISRQNGYYLLVKPGQKQKISFLISNLQNRNQNFRISPGMYITNDQGDMFLTTNLKQLDSSLPCNLMDMGVKPVYVTVPANRTVQINQEYQIPNRPFKGLIYGGIRVTSGLQSSQELKSHNSQTMINTYGQMDTGIILTMDKTYPHGELIVKKVLPVSSNPAPTFQIKVQNPQGTIIDQLNLKLKITKSGIKMPRTNFSKFELVKDYYGYTVAPYSNFDLTMNVGKKRLLPGQYKLELTGKSHGHEFKQQYRFMVAKNKAQKLNRDNSHVNPDYTWLYFIIIVAAALIVITLAILMYLFGKKHFTFKANSPVINSKKSNNLPSRSYPTNSVTSNHRYGKSNVPKRKR